MRIDGIMVLWFLLTGDTETGQIAGLARFARHTTDSIRLKRDAAEQDRRRRYPMCQSWAN